MSRWENFKNLGSNLVYDRVCIQELCK